VRDVLTPLGPMLARRTVVVRRLTTAWRTLAERSDTLGIGAAISSRLVVPPGTFSARTASCS
jgi:hypothetical protein